jgi:uncharacterized protein (DUF58 family)
VPATFGDVSSVRDYHAGDPLHHIHWRSVARRGELVVREFDDERHAHSTVIALVPDDPDTADVVASIATSLALASLRDAAEVALWSSGRITHERDADAVLEWGARLAPDDAPTIRPSNVVCVATPDAPALEALAPGLFVLVGAETGGRAHTLRAQGAAVAVVGAGEEEAWFSAGCAAS